jgi:hypothetical protein
MSTQTRALTWDYVCEIESQRDELLAALQEVLIDLRRWPYRDERLCERADDAIAKVQP